MTYTAIDNSQTDKSDESRCGSDIERDPDAARHPNPNPGYSCSRLFSALVDAFDHALKRLNTL